jgi:hypothetical protein
MLSSNVNPDQRLSAFIRGKIAGSAVVRKYDRP